MALAAAGGCLPDSSSVTEGTGGMGGTGTGGTAGMDGTGGGGGMIVAECPPGVVAPEPASGTTPLACRNSFNQVVSEFGVSLDVALDCAVAGEPFNASVTPTLTLDTTFLQAAADTLCVLGTILDTVTIENAQARVDAVQGATCTSQLSVLSAVPQDVELDVTVDGTCGAGGTITVNAGVALPLPQVSLPCAADDTVGGTVAFCATGVTPLGDPLAATTPPLVSSTEPPVDTWVTTKASAFTVAFACGGPASIDPAPGESVNCTAPNANGGECENLVGAGDFGEEPFPTSDCDFPSGIPFECTTVPVAVDPTTECVTFTLEELGTGGAGGGAGAGGSAGAGGA